MLGVARYGAVSDRGLRLLPFQNPELGLDFVSLGLVYDVDISEPDVVVFDPPWTPEMMTEDAKFALGY